MSLQFRLFKLEWVNMENPLNVNAVNATIKVRHRYGTNAQHMEIVASLEAKPTPVAARGDNAVRF